MVRISARSLDRPMVRAVAWTAAAKWAIQILSWTSTIVVARLLTPYDYGIIGMASLYLNLSSLISQAGIGDAIIALRDLSFSQIAELNTISLLMGAAVAGFSCAVAGFVARFFSAPPLYWVIVVASVTYLTNAFQTVPRALLQRELRFKLLASIETARGVLQSVVILLFAWLKFRYWSLLIGYIVACAATTVLTCHFKRHPFAIPRFGLLRRELKFTRHVLVSGVAWYVYDNADFGVAGRVLGGTALGNYNVAWTIASAPIEKVANLVTCVTPAFFSAVQADKVELRRYLLRLTEILSFITVPASIGLALCADYLVPVLLGPKWLGVIGPLRLLGVFVAARSLGTILPNLLTAVGDVRFVMWATISSAVVMPLAFLVGSHWGTNGIALAWVAAYPVIIAPMYYRVFKKTEMQLSEYMSVLLPTVRASVLMTAVILLSRLALSGRGHTLMGLSVIITAGVLSYIGTLFAMHRQRIITLTSMIRTLFKRQQPTQPPLEIAAVAGQFGQKI